MTEDTTLETQTATVNADSVVVNTVQSLPLSVPPVAVENLTTTTTQTKASVPPEVQQVVSDYFARAADAALAAHSAELNAAADNVLTNFQNSIDGLLQNVVHDKRSIYLVWSVVAVVAGLLVVLFLTSLFGTPVQVGRAEEILKFVGPSAMALGGIVVHHYSK